jgi:hypothetical protein
MDGGMKVLIAIVHAMNRCLMESIVITIMSDTRDKEKEKDREREPRSR